MYSLVQALCCIMMKATENGEREKALTCSMIICTLANSKEINIRRIKTSFSFEWSPEMFQKISIEIAKKVLEIIDTTYINNHDINMIINGVKAFLSDNEEGESND